jgi:hypothetical protein
MRRNYLANLGGCGFWWNVIKEPMLLCMHVRACKMVVKTVLSQSSSCWIFLKFVGFLILRIAWIFLRLASIPLVDTRCPMRCPVGTPRVGHRWTLPHASLWSPHCRCRPGRSCWFALRGSTISSADTWHPRFSVRRALSRSRKCCTVWWTLFWLGLPPSSWSSCN